MAETVTKALDRLLSDDPELIAEGVHLCRTILTDTNKNYSENAWSSAAAWLEVISTARESGTDMRRLARRTLTTCTKLRR